MRVKCMVSQSEIASMESVATNHRYFIQLAVIEPLCNVCARSHQSVHT